MKTMNLGFLMMALLSGCTATVIDTPQEDGGAGSKDANAADVVIPNLGYFCGVCKMYNGCDPKADAMVGTGDAAFDIHKTCQEIGACGSACADAGHK